jgi:hypothetical protein
MTSSTGKVLVSLTEYVGMSLEVTELLGETKIDLIAADTHEEVARLGVAMDEILRMYVFNLRNLQKVGVRKETPETDRTHQLICKEEDGLEAELSVAEVEEVFR